MAVVGGGAGHGEAGVRGLAGLVGLAAVDFGRKAGLLAVWAGLAARADRLLIGKYFGVCQRS